MARSPAALLTLLAAGLAAAPARAEPLAHAEHVCNRTVGLARDVLVEQPVEYRIKYKAVCGFLPCDKTRTELRWDSKVQRVLVQAQQLHCCPGYAETAERLCAPICLQSCGHGRCVRPDVCQCRPEPSATKPGFVGAGCTRFACLAPDRWGPDCERPCDCPAKQLCSASTGRCACPPGWRGPDCAHQCEAGEACDGPELPPILEAEPLAGRLEELSPRALQRHAQPDEGAEPRASAAGLVAAHVGANLVLGLLTLLLLFTLLLYRKRLNQLRGELYCSVYSQAGSSAPGAAAAYPASSRPRLATPDELGYLDKNLNFAAATRQTIKGAPELQHALAKPRRELHLLASHKLSQANLYSDVESPARGPQQLVSVASNTSGQADADEQAYAVPRSYASSSALGYDLPGRAAASPRAPTPPYENDASKESIYEEIRAPSPRG